MSLALTHWLSGPVLRARPQGVFLLREMVHVGDAGLLGEVIRIRQDEIVVQVYEDTTGLRLGAEVHGTGAPLSVELGPGLLGGIFDGLLRPMVDVEQPYVQPGLSELQARRLQFRPLCKPGDRLSPGTPIGMARPVGPRSGNSPGDNAVPERVVLASPTVGGTIQTIVAAGEYPEDVPLCRIEDAAGKVHEVAMRHSWPVRVPRPNAERLAVDEPLVTGQRVLDALFPVARGSKAAIPGGFGTGKTVLLETLAKWSGADIIVYVGCGERGNEMASMVDDLVRLEDPRGGRPLRERTVMIANTSNMPVAAREASIYTGVTVAEYYRDQGLHVALMSDSTSRWAEALREVSGRLGEIPGEAGYPAYLSSRLAQFYERAAKVRTLGGEIGSVTILGAVSPPSGDFSEPVVSHTRRYVRSFWALDPQRAHARFYPAINPLQSYSLDAEAMAPWWQAQGAEHWTTLRSRFLTLLEDQARLERMARIIGKDALPDRQRFTLLCADLLNEGYLRQSAYAPNERFAAPARQAAMMALVGQFFDLAELAADAGLGPEELAARPIYQKLLRMGEEIPSDDLEAFGVLEREIRDTADELSARAGAEPGVKQD